jgi:polyhydroxybutyrate depolymerase
MLIIIKEKRFTGFVRISFMLLSVWWCVSVAVAQTPLINDSIMIDGRYRTFHYAEPSAKARPNQLVFVLHGSGGSGRGIAGRAQRLQSIAEAENIMLVYPDGYRKFWNECRKAATSAANLENIDEGSFFRSMISYCAQRFGTDSNTVYAVGFSGGGHMAYKLALTMPEKFKAVTAVVANLPDSENMDCIESKLPVAVMIVNGTNDDVNPYNGGEVKVADVKLGTVRSTSQTFRYWAALAGYSGEPKKELLPDSDHSDDASIERYSFSSPGRPEVTLLKVLNGRHDHTKDIDVYLEAWNFFKRQQMKR